MSVSSSKGIWGYHTMGRSPWLYTGTDLSTSTAPWQQSAVLRSQRRRCQKWSGGATACQIKPAHDAAPGLQDGAWGRHQTSGENPPPTRGRRTRRAVGMSVDLAWRAASGRHYARSSTGRRGGCIASCERRVTALGVRAARHAAPAERRASSHRLAWQGLVPAA